MLTFNACFFPKVASVFWSRLPGDVASSWPLDLAFVPALFLDRGALISYSAGMIAARCIE